ncbi:oxidoreductase [Acidisoma silvae]|uniref:SDR family NAD(P)-dependent oxidoreductase n=1 Tax=Acidisoma silvae TaxID=2802396 RepID=A0A963YS39_9PROT|nr:oxidoreductase [Acidisoma silvae]MCB8875966.1 SDR family NAD(P)-dependent oxidoreductase [Acidisoma silvae]
MTTETPVWFITGCSTGFGRELVTLLLRQGYRVVATARDVTKIAGLIEGYEDKGLALALDVTDLDAIHHAVKQTEQKFGQIDVLVNNAGYGYMAAIEEGEDAPIRSMFDTNVFGLIDMTKAVLPGMRARHSGFVVNLSSIAGLRAFPGSGYYSATKHAVEAVSESLAQEGAPLGIKVLLVEPGPFRTDFAGRSLGRSKTVIADYDSTVHARLRMMQGYSGSQKGDPVRAAQAIIDVVASSNPPLRLVLGAMAMDGAREKVRQLTADFDTWEETTLGADFPEA